MTQQDLKQPYSRPNWQAWLSDIFGSQIQFESQAEHVEVDRDILKSIQRFATVKLADGKNLAVLDIETLAGVKIARNRVGLQVLVKNFIGNGYHAILAFYHSEDTTQTEYRLSFISSELTIDAEGNIKEENTPPKRFTYVLGENAKTKTPADRLKTIADKRGKATLDDIKNAFSVETLTKEFYAELSNWYFWALQNVQFPDDADREKLLKFEDETARNNEAKKLTELRNATAVIRLITRLIFVWFLKQKKLIADELFDIQELENMLNYNDKTGSTFYKAILQNLFFATLNTEMGEKRKFVNRQSGIQGFYRYERFFKNKERFAELTQNTPFLNGGLFENLDKNVGEPTEKRIDCFSNRMDKELLLKVPDFLFFGEENPIDLNKIYDTRGKTYKVRGLIDMLKTYNFTIEENTPTDIEVALDPELLGKVFENLLASFNPETQTTARKQTGSFYTPREIVDYMVQESLTAYLEEKVGKNWENDPRTISALNDIRILDPACGSGAFPMGILQKMVQILQKLDPDNKQWREVQKQKAIAETEESYNICDKEERQKRLIDIDEAFDNNVSDYGRKLYLIENCIFGIDIQSIAVQISKLRFFISLICEQTPNPEKPNLGIRPLPNLETKFVAANTLIGLDKPKKRVLGMDIIDPLEKELAEVRHKHFSARTTATKANCRIKDSELRSQIAEKLKDLGFPNDTAEKVAQWNPYDQNVQADWFDAESMFGLKKGNALSGSAANESGYFDIVIGNPPYVQLQKNGGELSKLYGPKKEGRKTIPSLYQTFDSMGDIYSLFYERGYQLLKPQGRVCFITSNKWMRTGYGENTRRFFAENTNPEQLIDFAGVKIFESATVDTNILIFSKDKNRQQTQACIVQKEGIKDLHTYIKQSSTVCSFVSADSWVLLSPIEKQIKSKIDTVGTPLKDWGIQINFGIKTGFNEAFIISGEKRKELIEKDPKSAEVIRPVLRGRDIQRFGYDFTDLYLLYIPWHFPLHNDITVQGASKKAEQAFMEQYPAIYNYLLQHKNDLLNRNKAETGIRYEWYALQRWGANYWEYLDKPKIIWKRIGSILRFCYDEEKHIVLDSTCFASGENLKYLIGILNSKMGNYLLQESPKTGTGDLLISVQAIEPIKIPLPDANNEQQQQIIALVNQILSAKKENPATDTTDLEKQIDELVYALYGLMEEEVFMIEHNIN